MQHSVIALTPNSKIILKNERFQQCHIYIVRTNTHSSGVIADDAPAPLPIIIDLFAMFSRPTNSFAVRHVAAKQR